jgi:hypothetical protein
MPFGEGKVDLKAGHTCCSDTPAKSGQIRDTLAYGPVLTNHKQPKRNGASLGGARRLRFAMQLAVSHP